MIDSTLREQPQPTSSSASYDDDHQPVLLIADELSTSRPPSALEKWFVKRLYSRMGLPEISIVFWDGTTSIGRGDGSKQIILRHPAAIRRLIFDVVTGFGEAYMADEIGIRGNLIDIISTVTQSMTEAKFFDRPHLRLFEPLLNHSFSQSRSHVEFHYDLGNEFFKLWLDKQCVYTCAYYPHAKASLEEAQTAKMDHICRKLRLKPGEMVFEAGCGWGSLALHMARNYGVRVRAYNLSREQLDYARERTKAAKMGDQVEFIEDDYRNISGKCDAFVSVGMLEHVGKENYRLMGRMMNRVLTQSGRGLIHTIGRNVGRPLDRWTVKYIFPAAYPPSLREMMNLFEESTFSVLDVENLRLHYARTCAEWLTRFDRAVPQIESLFDSKFVRMWRLYLAASSAAFHNGDLQLFQILFVRSDNNTLPWTRDDFYS